MTEILSKDEIDHLLAAINTGEIEVKTKPFSKCVKANNGEAYCWDKNGGMFVKITAERVAVSHVPTEVIKQFMDIVFDRSL